MDQRGILALPKRRLSSVFSTQSATIATIRALMDGVFASYIMEDGLRAGMILQEFYCHKLGVVPAEAGAALLIQVRISSVTFRFLSGRRLTVKKTFVSLRRLLI